MNKEKYKDWIKVLLLVILVVFIILYIGDYVKREKENPYRVGEAFTYSYMAGYKEGMKQWADDSIYKKIKSEDIQEIDNLARQNLFDPEYFYLKSLKRPTKDILIATYIYKNSSNKTNAYLNLPHLKTSPLYYTVIIEPVGEESLLEKISKFLNISLFRKDNWSVTNYYSENRREIIVPPSKEIKHKEIPEKTMESVKKQLKEVQEIEKRKEIIMKEQHINVLNNNKQ